MKEVAILGGGIAGLSAGYRLASAGMQVSLFEASDRLGGLGAHFEHDGMRLDRYYHVMLDSDDHLIRLIDEVGLSERIAWSETGMGFIVKGRSYPFNTPFDLLKFGALGFLDRIRTGIAALYITKFKTDGTPLDNEPAHEWLKRLFGRRVYRNLWEPLLTAKFGDLRDRVPAYWIWNTLNREKDGNQEVKGYLEGGYAVLADRLAAGIEDAGGHVHLNARVQMLDADHEDAQVVIDGEAQTYDAVVSTLPLPLLHGIAGPDLVDQVPQPDLEFQGVVNVVLIHKRRVCPHYWTAVVDSGLPFQGVVETTHVIRPEWIGNRHMLYLMNYCSADSAAYRADDTSLVEEAIAGMDRLFPQFDPAEVEHGYVFRAPHVEPVWTLGYLEKRPRPQVGALPVYLATTAQAYPMVTSWNTSVKLADDAVTALQAAEQNRDSSVLEPALAAGD